MRAVVAILLFVTAAHAALWGLFQEKQPAPDFRGILPSVSYAPFEGTDGRAILAQQLAGKADLTRVPEALRDWFAKGLNPDPDARFADAQMMRDAWNEAARPLVRETEDLPLAARIRRAAEQLFG